METIPYFKNIRNIIVENLKGAQKDIYIAMAWFTNHEIFSIILEKANKIPVGLIVINDDINNKSDGLDFQKFIDAGGKFYFARKEIPMHNKFCIIDSRIVITGSYNYTYFAETINNENIVVFKDEQEIANAFIEEFKNITSDLTPVTSVVSYHEQNPVQTETPFYNQYLIKDVYAHSTQLINSNNITEAKKLINQINVNPKMLELNEFIIYHVFYRLWKNDYITEKIKVINKELILYFKTKTKGGGCYIHGPHSKYVWTLQNTEKKHLRTEATRIANITVNGITQIKSLEDESLVYFSSKDDDSHLFPDLDYKFNVNKELIKDDGSIMPFTFFKIDDDIKELSCEIHFNVDGFPLETVDLIEGLGTEDKENHWHCFDINLKLNREVIVS